MGRDPEATATGPFFSEAAEETAQPVVPLAAEGGMHHSAVVVPVPEYAARKRAPAWPLALIVVSLLTGLMGGVAGLWLYQRTRNAEARPATAAEQTSDATQPAPPQETTPVAADAQLAEPETAETETAAPVVEDEAADVEPEEVEQPQVETRRAEEEQQPRERESAEAAPPPRAQRDEERRGRGDDDDDRDGRARERFEPRPGVVYDTQGPVEDGSASARRAEREEQRLRRAERQRRREERRQRREGREERAVDSVRGIFEGQPPE